MPTVISASKLCMRLRALDLPGAPCPHFPNNEKISNFFDCESKKLGRRPAEIPGSNPGAAKVFKFRKRWYEHNEAAKAYAEHNVNKFNLFGHPIWMLKLPRDFTCFHFCKTVQIEDRQHFVMAIDLAKPKGALEYGMLEVDRAILRKAK